MTNYSDIHWGSDNITSLDHLPGTVLVSGECLLSKGDIK